MTTQTRAEAGGRRRSPAKKAAGAAKATPARPETEETQARPETEGRTEGAAAPSEARGDLVTWEDVPMPHLKVPVVHMRAQSARSLAENAKWTARTITGAIPQPKRLLFYGGVGALAAFGILEWPVAVTAAAGVWVATHTIRRVNGHGQMPPGEKPEGERSEGERAEGDHTARTAEQ